MARPGIKPFYNSQAWQAARSQALRRDHFTCQICGQRASEVHHLIELDDTNVNDADVTLNIVNLQSLCHECHTRVTMREHRGAKGDVPDGFLFDEEGFLIRDSGVHPPGGAK